MASSLSRLSSRAFLSPALAAAVVAGGCMEQARYQQTVTSSAPHVSGSGLKVTSRNGAITVQQGSSETAVTIKATLRMVTEARLGEASIVANRTPAGVLEISAQPPTGGWRTNEGCSFDVTVPDVSGVELISSNGAITMSGLSGVAKLDTSNGRITVRGHRGDLFADTSNGRIEATGVTGAVDARTSNGAVSISMADAAAGPVTIDTSNGSVTLDLTPSFRGTLEAHTSNGSVRMPEGAPAGVSRYSLRSTGRRATLEVGEGGPASSIDTSNGSVTVRFGGR